jgi:hypothetical protein
MRTKKVTLPTAGAFTSLADYGLVYHSEIITPQRGFKESGFLCIAFIVLDGAKVREKRSDNPASPYAYSLRPVTDCDAFWEFPCRRRLRLEASSASHWAAVLLFC